MALRITRPIVLEVLPGGFKIIDGKLRDLAYVYVKKNKANAAVSGRLTPLEGEELAQMLARFLDDEAKPAEG